LSLERSECGTRFDFVKAVFHLFYDHAMKNTHQMIGVLARHFMTELPKIVRRTGSRFDSSLWREEVEKLIGDLRPEWSSMVRSSPDPVVRGGPVIPGSSVTEKQLAWMGEVARVRINVRREVGRLSELEGHPVQPGGHIDLTKLSPLSLARVMYACEEEVGKLRTG
jgi:hypothetical protein